MGYKTAIMQRVKIIFNISNKIIRLSQRNIYLMLKKIIRSRKKTFSLLSEI